MKNLLPHVHRLRHALLLLPLLCFVLITNKAVAQDWSAIGNGLPFWTHAVCEYNGEIIAGGEAPGFLKRFDGANWVDIGGGVDGQVNALTVYNGELIAAGQFVNAGGIEVMFIAKWDGIEWLDLEGGTNSTVSALTVYNGNLIAGGYFTDANGPANYIAQWDGHAWSALGTGTGGSQGQVLALTVYQNELIAAGFFTSAGGNPANHIAKWNGTTWSTLGGGVAQILYALTPYGSNLVAGPGLVWNGSTWSTLGVGPGGGTYGYTLSLCANGTNLYAGGIFTSAGGSPASSVAKWDGTSWSNMNGGVFHPSLAAVFVVTPYQNGCIAGGIFSSAGGTSTSHIAQWNEAGAPSPPAINNLTILPNGDNVTLSWSSQGSPYFLVYDDVTSDGLYNNLVAVTSDTFTTLPLDPAQTAERYYIVIASEQMP